MADKQKVLLQIEGMTCDGCAVHVRKALSGTAGVAEVRVPDWRAAKAELVADDSVSDDRLIKAIEDAGYRVLARERRALDEGR